MSHSHSHDSPKITLYTAQTPNGVKISILLEMLHLPYNVRVIDFSKNEQKEPWFLEINPNGRIPALRDESFNNGKGIDLFESGAIMMYLCENYDKDHKLSYPRGTRECYEVCEWVFFQNANIGPMQGQANHFIRYAPEKIEYGIKRYKDETCRLYNVLDMRMKNMQRHGFIVGDRMTIADMCCYGWVKNCGLAEIDINEFPMLKKWCEKMGESNGVKKGRDVPHPSKVEEALKDKKKMAAMEKEGRAWMCAENK
jgi:glutathione S-transferase